MEKKGELNGQLVTEAIIFNEGRETLGLDLSIVKEVIEIDHVKPFPLASKKIEGIINLREEVLPVINTKIALNITDDGKLKSGKSRIVIIEHPLEKFGLLVDTIQEILPLEAKLFSDLPDSVQTEIDLKYIEQIGMFRNKPLIMINIDTIIENLFISLPASILSKTKTRISRNGDENSGINHLENAAAKSSVETSQSPKIDTSIKIEPKTVSPVKAQTKPSSAKKQVKKGQSEKIDFTEADLDVFSELGNIGAGHASNALSQMINKKVMIDVPQVSLVTLDKLRPIFGKIGEIVTGSFSLVPKNMDANILLIFSVPSIEFLLQIILDQPKIKKLKSMSDISENEQSAIQELNSILIGHYLAALSNFLHMSIDPPKHNFFFEKTDVFFTNLEKDSEKDVVSVVIETKMNVVGTDPIVGYFLMIPSAQNLKDILKRIHEVWEK